MDPIVVVGSGMSGAAVALALVRSGASVLVLECGPGDLEDHVAADPRTSGLLDPGRDPQFLSYGPSPGAIHYGAGAGIRRRVGGRSLYWRGIVLRIEPYALNTWPDAVRDRLLGRTADRDGLYAKTEQALERWSGRPLAAPRSEHEATLLTHIRRTGFCQATPTPRAVQIAGGDQWRAYTPALQLPKDVIRSGTRVAGLEPKGDRGCCIRLEASGAPGTLQASAVVLAAGTVENARLAAPFVGPRHRFNIVDHHAQGWVVSARAVPNAAGCQGASILLDRDPATRTNTFLEVHERPEGAIVDVWSMGEQIPSGRSVVSFPGPDGPPRFDVELGRTDEALIAAQWQLLRRVAGELGVRSPCRLGSGETAGFDAAADAALASPGRALRYHCPLGASDHDACSLGLGGELVGCNGALKRDPRVFLAGPCLFPRAGAANPSLTTLALGTYIAEQVLEQIAR